MKIKKIICIVLVLLIMLLSMNLNAYAATPTLEEIATSFNNCDTVKGYATNGSVWKATSSGNKLMITVTANDETTNVEYTLEDTILSANFSKENALTELAVSMILTDCIGQLHGYSDGELFTTLNSEKVVNYTVENEGLEIIELPDNGYQIKIDISKKIPLIDVSDVYIKVSDLEDLKEFITGKGSAEKSKGNIWFNKSTFDDKEIILIAEKDKLTDNAHKSILSIIEVMFNSSKASDYFKTNYSGMSVGNKEFTGFKIEINPTKTEFEENLIPTGSGYEFARITIDKDLVNSAISGSNNTENKEENKETEKNTDIKTDDNNSNKEQDNTVAKGNLPQTGWNIAIPIVSAIVITLSAIVLLRKYNNYKDVK